MKFDPEAYGAGVAAVLALDAGGNRLMPLVAGACSCPFASPLIRAIREPAVAAGLWVYYSAFDEAHAVAQDLPTREGSYWHAILHRQEPDAWNSQYWFNRVGEHAIFPRLAEEAAGIARRYPGAGWKPPVRWDPSRFIECAEQARAESGSELEQLAREIQRAEWQLLFDYCARPR